MLMKASLCLIRGLKPGCLRNCGMQCATALREPKGRWTSLAEVWSVRVVLSLRLIVTVTVCAMRMQMCVLHM